MIGFRGETDFGMRGMRFEKNADKGSGKPSLDQVAEDLGTPGLDQDAQVEKSGSNEYFSYRIIEYPLRGQEGKKGAVVLITASEYSVGKLFGTAMNAVAEKMRKIQQEALENCAAGSHIDMILELGNLAVPNPLKNQGVVAEVDKMAELTLSTYENVHLHICALEYKLGFAGKRLWNFFSGSVLKTASLKGYTDDKAITNYGLVDEVGLQEIIDNIKMAKAA